MKSMPLAAIVAVQLALAPTAQAELSKAESGMAKTVAAEQDRSLTLLEKLVNQNSGSLNLEGVEKVGAMMRAELEPLGFKVEWKPMTDTGRAGHLIATHAGKPDTKRLLLIAASLTTAAAVAFSGIIGFIGLIVPHVVRMIWGPDYRRLTPLSILGGATLLLLADILARVALAPQVLPVGVVTALAGAPFFLWILYRAKTKVTW